MLTEPARHAPRIRSPAGARHKLAGSRRETHLRIEGPALRELYAAFIEPWTEATGEVLGVDHIPEPHGFDDGVEVLVSRSTPTGWATATTLIFFAAIAGARRRLWLTTAYFVPDRGFEDLLCRRPGGTVPCAPA